MTYMYGSGTLGTRDFTMEDEGVHVGDTNCAQSMVHITMVSYGYR